MFKIGDKVRLKGSEIPITRKNYSSTSGMIRFLESREIYTIKRVKHNREVISLEGSFSTWHPDDFRAVNVPNIIGGKIL